MAKREVNSVFEVTDYKTGKKEEVTVEGAGQETVKALARDYPRHTKFVLEGFEIDGNFVTLKFRR